MSALTVIEGDNLTALAQLAAQGARFDLVEIDGPYGAGLEAWDRLTEDAYLAHYAARLPLVARCLEPWGVVFLFGYPEGCALVRAWAKDTDTLYLRRWLTWYVQSTQHAGRRVQSILMFVPSKSASLWSEFQRWLQQRRQALGLTVVDAHKVTGINTAQGRARGGYLWFEAATSSIPTVEDYAILKRVFTVPDRFDALCELRAFDGLTDIDYITVGVERAAQLSTDLRSKPEGLYWTLFPPVVPPRPQKRALVLYGGSGNAALVAGRLGYDVTVCEQDPARCEQIRRRWAGTVEGRDTTPRNELGPLFAGVA